MLDFVTGLVMDSFLPLVIALAKFLPTIVILLTVVAFFENSGIVLGFSCTTLAVSAIDNNKSALYKRRFVRLTSFIPCSAKLPVISFIAGTVLGWSVFGTAFLYIASIFLGIMLGGYKVITLPKFKPLSLIDFFKTLLKNILQFLSRISVGLVLAVTALYTLQYFNLLIPFTSIFSPIFAPIGLSSPSVIACLMFGLVAKEMIVGAILSFGVAALELTTAGAVSFILFALLYTPCLPALTAIKSKLGLFAAIKQAFYNFAVAYVVCLLVYLSTVVLSFII